MTKAEITKRVLRHLSERIRMQQTKIIFNDHIDTSGLLDGSENIEEAIDRLYDLADNLEEALIDGYEITKPVTKGIIQLKLSEGNQS